MSMSYTLYIWGPADPLPTFDAECVAAIALLRSLLPSDIWEIVVAHAAGPQSTKYDLPALQHQGEWCRGYHAIRTRLERDGYSLDSKLTPQQRAQVTALTEHIHTAAHLLTDVHLYSTSPNHAATNRTFSRILPFPYGWLIPPRRAAQARARLESLGLALTSAPPWGASDPDRTGDASQEGVLADSSAPSLIFARRQKTQATLRQQASAARFRIEAAVDTLCEPFSELLQAEDGQRYAKYVIGKQLTSADCLALGYFCVLLFANLPDQIVTETIRARWNRVAIYADFRFMDIFPAPSPQPGAQYFIWGVVTKPAPPPTVLDRLRAFTHSINNILTTPTTRQQTLSVFTLRSWPLLGLGLAAASICVGTFSFATNALFFAKKRSDLGLPPVEYEFRLPKKANENLIAPLYPDFLDVLFSPPRTNPPQQGRHSEAVDVGSAHFESQTDVDRTGQVEAAEVTVEIDK